MSLSASLEGNPTIGVILAAGKSSRFGETSKLAADFFGKSILQRACETAVASSLHRVIVVLGANSPNLRRHCETFEPSKVEVVFNPDFAQGQSTSVLRGLDEADRSTPPPAGVVFLAADQPLLQPRHIDAVLHAALNQCGSEKQPMAAAQATSGNKRGTPVFFPRDLFVDLRRTLGALKGDEGGRALLRELPDDQLVEVTVDVWALADVDEPSDLARLKALHQELGLCNAPPHRRAPHPTD